MHSRARLVFVLALALAPSLAWADEPLMDVSASRHGNLAAAQSLVTQAYDKITAAQRANRYYLGGHADKAKGLLRRANIEISLAARAANRH